MGLICFVAVCYAIHLHPFADAAGSQEPGRRWSYEAVLLLVAQILTVVALYQLWWAAPHTETKNIPMPIPFRRAPPFHLWVLVCACYWSAYGVLRWIGYRGARLLLPIVCLLSGMGFTMIERLDPSLGQRQACWIGAGLMVYSATGVLLRDYKMLLRLRWIWLGLAVVLQLGLIFWGVERNGAKLWYDVGPCSFQPIEIVKVLLLLFIASCLLPLMEQSGSDPRAIRRLTLGFFAICWAGAEVLLGAQRDLGMALLLFGVFLGLFFVATGRLRWIAFILGLAILGSGLSYRQFGHVRTRVEAWSQPWEHVQDSAYQLTQGLFAVAAGGWSGRGWGRGVPDFVPEVSTDFIFVALAEEIGGWGGLALIAAYILLILVAFQAAARCRDAYARLLIVGLATLEGWQTTIILFGILRIAPMTGLTLPFISYGGSSMVANFLALGILQRLTQPDCAGPPPAVLSTGRDRWLRNALIALLLVAAAQLVNLNVTQGPFLRQHPANPRI